jgi:uncharacterized YigZ family protein
MPKDSYQTFKSVSEGLFKDRGSKFLSFGYPVTEESQVKEIINERKRKFHDARHHCFAYKFGVTDSNFRMNDDGEPSGTAGKPIFGQIVAHNLSDVLIVVVRYFGGTLLGTSGLINAYRSAAADCINNAVIIEKQLKKPLLLNYKYDLLSLVMRIVKDEDLEITAQDFREDCNLSLLVRELEFERICKKFSDIYGLKINPE